ncbi:MAG: FKBP-type peptidyl-prolyl cis-trans isomerase, partial [Clostridia bacterium]|nr:FKBP-type peptidyl-prolyl cis-trans isomerase [Clostridia bacterium]
MIPGFDKAVVDMDVGDMVDIHLMPEEAYGPVNPNAFIHAPLSALPRGDELEVGMRIYLQGPTGAPMPVKVVEKDEETITFDANHELAGQELNFKIELVEVLD